MSNLDDFPAVLREAPYIGRSDRVRYTRVTYRLGRTQSLGNYSNVRPEVELEATLDPGDDYAAVRAMLRAEAKKIVEEECDLALEADGQPARFSAEPRYQIIRTRESVWVRRRQVTAPERLLIILPDALRLPRSADLDMSWWGQLTDGRRQRLDRAWQLAVAYADERLDEAWQIIDASDGSLSRVPAWVFEVPVAPPYTQEEAALAAANYWAHHRGGRPLVVACVYSEALAGWRVEVQFEGVEAGGHWVLVSDEGVRLLEEEEEGEEEEEEESDDDA